MSLNLQRKIVAIASATPQLALQNAYPLHGSNSAFRITASHTLPVNSLNRSDYIATVASLFDSKFRLVEDTIEQVQQNNNNIIVSGIIEANVAVRDFNEDEVRASMRVLAANVFQDDEDSLWTVVESNGKKQLVQSVKEDFAKIVASRLSRKASQVVANAGFNGLVPSNGDYIVYYNVESKSLRYGFALQANDITVIDRQSREAVAITTANVIDIVPGEQIDNKHSLFKHMREDNQILSSDLGNNYLERYLQYTRNLFAGTDYFAALEKLVAKRRKFGDNNQYISTFRN